MKRRIALILSVCFFQTLSCFGQSNQDLLPIRLNSKAGLINTKGEIIVKPVYDAIDARFSGGYLLVRNKDKTGIVDSTGTEIITTEYDHIEILADNFFVVHNNGFVGVIDNTNKLLIPLDYTEIRYLDSNLFVCFKDTLCGLVDANNKLILDLKFSDLDLIGGYFILSYQGLLKGLYSKDGKCILNTEYAGISVINRKSILISKDANFWGVINDQGQILLNQEWRNYIRFSNFIGLKRQGKWAVFSLAENRLITELKYDTLSSFLFSVNHLICNENGLLGIVDVNAGEIISPIYDKIELKPPIGFQLVLNGKIGLTDFTGKILFEPIYDEIIVSQDNDKIVILNQEGKLGLSSLAGKQLLPITSNRIILYEDKAKVFENGKLTIINFTREGGIDEQITFENVNTIRVDQDNSNSNRRVDLDSRISPRNYGWFRKSQYSKWGFMDSSGQIIKNPIYSDVFIDTILDASIVYLDIPGTYNGFNFLGENIILTKLTGIYDHNKYKYRIHPQIWDIRISDFDQGAKVARIITPNNNYFGFVTNTGKAYTKDIAFFGDFHEGLAKICYNGELKHAEEMFKDKTVKISREICDTVFYNKYWSQSRFSFNKSAFSSAAEKERRDRFRFTMPIPLYVDQGNWGFMNSEGKLQIAAEYDFVKDFKYSRAIVLKGNKWGVISSTNEKLIDFNYDFIDRLQDSRDSFFCIVNDNSIYGIIDGDGNVVIGPSFSFVGSFSESIAKVRIGKKWGFINTKGEIIIDVIYDHTGDFHEGLAAVQKGRKWGFINSDGELVIQHKYRSTGDFVSGLARVYEKSKCGYINKKGQYEIEPKFSSGSDVINRHIIVRKNGRTGLINKKGNWVLKPHYTMIAGIDNTNYFLLRARNKYGILNAEGEKIVPIKYDFIGTFVNGIASARKNELYGYIDTSGKEVIPFEYTANQQFSEGLAGVRIKTKWGYIDRNNQLILDAVYNSVRPFHENRAVVTINRKEGVINREGLLLLEPKYTAISDYSNNRAITNRFINLQFIDTNANVLFNLKQFSRADTFIDGKAIVGKNEKFGLIDYYGNYTCNIKYSRFQSIGNGLYAYVKPSYSGLADLNGNILLEPNYEVIEYFGDGIFRVEMDNKTGYYNLNQGWIWKPSR